MKHATEEDLLTLHWEGTRRTAAHVASCPECADRLRTLRALLERVEAEPVPERGEEYGREVWARLAPRLRSIRQAARRPWFFAPRPLAAAGALAAVVLAAFLAGQAAARRAAPTPAARDRVLLIAVGEHLERTEAVLLELVHGPREGEGGLDVSSEQARLSDLLPANRLYRQAATRSGEAGVSGVLDELERILLDVRHGPSKLSAVEREALARRIDAEGVLFKVRILGSRLRDRAASSAPAAPERKRV
jgi:hypothetical protein